MKSLRKMSIEEMRNLVLEKVPLEERMRSVYIPLIAMDCACYLGEDLLQTLRELKLDSTKKLSREIKQCIEGYRRDNYMVMRSDLYKRLENFTETFHNGVKNLLVILQWQYQQEMTKRGVKLSADIRKIISFACALKKMIQYVIDLDRSFSKRISDLLGDDIHYTTEDNRYCVRMINAINSLQGSLDIPSDLMDMTSVNVENEFRAYTNKLNQLKL